MAASAWPDTRLLELLGIEHPIVQAPMKGTTTPALAAAVSEAGGLGSLGCAGLSPDELRDTVAEMRRRTNRGFNLNFFAHPAVPADPPMLARVRERLAPFYREKGLGEPPEGDEAIPAGFDDDLLAVLLADPPRVVSFHFGVPEREAVSALKAAGVRVLSTANTVGEARALEAAGVDAIIAQGWEAGGHRGAFTADGREASVGLFALVPQVVDAVAVPVIAAGGIADGRGIAAAFMLGASGVQIGTAFAACPELSAPERHRAAIAGATAISTLLSRARSGGPARAERTRYLDAMAAAGDDWPPFPAVYGFTQPLQATGDPDFAFLLYGQSAALVRARPAAELVAALASEAAEALARGGG